MKDGDSDMTRDLTKAQFDAACERRGFKREFMGYYNVGNGVTVYARNAGERRRHQLVYLIREAARAAREQDSQ